MSTLTLLRSSHIVMSFQQSSHETRSLGQLDENKVLYGYGLDVTGSWPADTFSHSVLFPRSIRIERNSSCFHSTLGACENKSDKVSDSWWVHYHHFLQDRGVIKGGRRKKKKWNGPATHHRRLCVICFGCVFLMGWALPQLNLALLAGFYRYASITAEAHSSRDVEMNVQARRMYSSSLFIIMGLPLGAKSFHAYFFKLDNRQVWFRHNTLPCPLALIGSTNVVS